MFGISMATKAYLALGPTDMRKSINTLSILVQGHLRLDPFCGHYFGFCNRRRNLVKVLYWDRNGFCLWQKRLERDRFDWPRRGEEVMELGQREFFWLIEGLELERIKGPGGLCYHGVL
jgi:transposase